MKRLRLADGEPMAIELLHVRQALLPDLSAADLEQASFYDLLEQRYGIEIVGGSQAVEPTVTNEEESEVLGVPLGTVNSRLARALRDLRLHFEAQRNV